MNAKMPGEPASLVSETPPNAPNPIPSTEKPNGFAFRALVDSRYDMQRLRIAVGHRRLRILRSWVTELKKMGMDYAQIAHIINTTRIDRVYPAQSVSEREIREVDEELQKEVADEMEKAEDDPTYHPRTNYPEISATKHTDEVFFLFADLVDKEKRIESHLKPVVDASVTGRWLISQRGISYILAAGLLAYFDPARARHASSYWKFAGVAVDKQGHADRLVAAKVIHPKSGPCKECECPKYNPDPSSEEGMCACGHPLKIEGQKAPYSKMAKWLAFNVAQSFIKSGSPYKHLYDESKVKYLAKYGTKGGQRDHAHKSAMRVMVKRFLVEFWKMGRAEAGLPVDEPYIFGPGGHSNPEPDIGIDAEE